MEEQEGKGWSMRPPALSLPFSKAEVIWAATFIWYNSRRPQVKWKLKVKVERKYEQPRLSSPLHMGHMPTVWGGICTLRETQTNPRPIPRCLARAVVGMKNNGGWRPLAVVTRRPFLLVSRTHGSLSLDSKLGFCWPCQPRTGTPGKKITESRGQQQLFWNISLISTFISVSR